MFDLNSAMRVVDKKANIYFLTRAIKESGSKKVRDQWKIQALALHDCPWPIILTLTRHIDFET